MAAQRVAAREEVPAIVAKGDFQRVRLHRVAVPLEINPLTETCGGAKPALEHADSPACPIGRRSLEERPVPLVKASRDAEELALRLL